MASKSIANKLNVQILALVLKSLQNGHHGLNVCLKICKPQVSIKTEGETLMNVELFLLPVCCLLGFSVLCCFYH
jgi:hypothetical protein